MECEHKKNDLKQMRNEIEARTISFQLRIMLCVNSMRKFAGCTGKFRNAFFSFQLTAEKNENLQFEMLYYSRPHIYS